jgi:hypothetical protein
MLVLAMQFSRSSKLGLVPNLGHEDAGAATEWPCRRSLGSWPEATPSKQKTGQCVGFELDRREVNTYDQRRCSDSIERGSNWESSLRCAGTMTP